MADHHKAQNAKQTNEAAHQHRSTEPVHQEWTRFEQADQATLQRAVANPGLARPADILGLQRAYGNQAVTRLIQAKLRVGPMGDHYEQEADRVAEQVMSMPAPISGQQSAVRGQPSLQRQAPEEGDVQAKPLAASITPLVQRQEVSEEEELQMKPLVQRQEVPEEEELQMKPVGARRADGGFWAGDDIERRLAGLKGSGSPLPEETRTDMEARFGADFSEVRGHADGAAAQLTRTLRAKAFTHGRDVYFGAGSYDPGSDAGKRLLAHELTHVVQQSTGRVEGGGSRPIREREVIQRRDVQIGGESHTTLGQVNHTDVSIVRRSKKHFWSRKPNERFLWNEQAGPTDVPLVQIENNDLNRLNQLFDGLHALDVRGLGGLLRTMIKHTGMGHSIPKQLDRLRQIRRNIEDEVRQRVNADIAQLVTRGMLPAGSALQSIKLTGSDIHKGGRAVVILNFNTPAGERKLVYKPGDLGIDEMIYGSQQRAFYTAHNLKLPTYQLWTRQAYNIAAGEAGITGAYGYEEFVAETGPQSAADLMSIYQSLADNMAVGYIMGYRDIHHENFIIKQTALQVIDIEAMTGHSEGLRNQGWPFIMNDLVKRVKAAGAPNLPGHTITGNIANTVRNRFTATVALLRQGGAAAAVLPAQAAVQQRTARFVPVATTALQNLVSRYQGQLIAPVQVAAYDQRITDMMDEEGYGGDYKWNTQLQKQHLITLLTHPDTRRELHHGNVPFYMRRLDSNDIYSSRGNLVVQNMHHVNIDPTATPAAAIATRRAPGALSEEDIHQLDAIINQLVQAHTNNFPAPAPAPAPP